MMSLEEIREKLNKRNMSEVAREIGVTSAYLSAIKRGVKVNPSYDTVKKLSEALKDGWFSITLWSEGERL